MNILERFKRTKQDAYNNCRPAYFVPQPMSAKKAQALASSHADLQKAYAREMAKPASQRDTKLAYEMDRQLNPRMCGW